MGSTAAKAARLTVEEDRALDYCFEQGWTDGLPVVPPTVERVEAMIAAAGRDPERDAQEIVGEFPLRRRTLTLEQVAANAVMAGCLPEYFPVLLAAVQAICEERFCLNGPASSTGGAGLLMIVNGPIVERLRINCRGNVFGPGARANATLGRALRLVVMNLCGAISQVTDRSTLGSPGKYTFCIAENEADSPWTPFSVERGMPAGRSAVTVFACYSPVQISDHITDRPEGILDHMSIVLSALGEARTLGHPEIAVILCGEHMRLLAQHGWSKDDVRAYLVEHAKAKRINLKHRGLDFVEFGPDDEELESVVLAPEDYFIIAAGGSGGKFSAFIPGWGANYKGPVSRAVTKLIAEP